MLALGLVLNTLGIGLFCWAIFALAMYALPFFVALSVGMTALQSGAGVVGALLIGTAGGALTLVLGQIAVAATRSQIAMPSPASREVFACLGAVCVAGTAWTRLTVFAEARPFEPVGAVEKPSHQFLRPPRARDDRSPPSSPNRFA